MSNDREIEAAIVAAGADKAPRISVDMIEQSILSEHYMRASEFPDLVRWPTSVTALSCLTICVLVLKNGYTVVGKSACASPENFNAEIGGRIAREDAVRQIWALEGYRLRCELAAK